MTSYNRPRAVATDLDGTLLRSDGSLSDRTRAAIIAAEDAGITTVFVTARPPRWLDSLADAVGPHGTVLCGNGAFVYDVPTRTVTEHYPIEDLVLKAIVDDLRAAVPEIAFAVERADGLGREESFVYRSEKPDLHSVDDLSGLTATPVGKLLGRCESMESAQFLATVIEIIAGRAEVGYSGAVGLAEITAQGVTKAAALERWSAEHGLTSDDVWAFGDMPNDLPMIVWAGTGFAVSNGHPDVIAAADRVCPANDDDGVAQMLESLLSF